MTNEFMIEFVNERKYVFNWIKKTELTPKLYEKKYKLSTELNRLDGELKEVDKSIELIPIVDDFCEYARIKLFEILASFYPNLHESDEDSDEDNDDNDDGDRCIDICQFPARKEQNNYVFDGKYSQLFDAYCIHCTTQTQYSEIFDYLHKQLEHITKEIITLFPKLIIPRLCLSQWKTEIIPFREYRFEGVCVKLYYRVF